MSVLSLNTKKNRQESYYGASKRAQLAKGLAAQIKDLSSTSQSPHKKQDTISKSLLILVQEDERWRQRRTGSLGASGPGV